MRLVTRWFYRHTLNGYFIRYLQVVINSMWQYFYRTNNASVEQDTACKVNVSSAKKGLHLAFPHIYTS